MKIATTLFLMAPLWAQLPARPATITSEKPNAARPPMADVEKRVDAKLSTIGGADPVYILGLTRGLYLGGYGTVLTAELDLIPTPVPTPFHQQITKDEAIKVHQRKIEHLALLRKTMREIWADAASALTSTPDTEQIVLAVRLFYRPWEDTSGLPAQIVMTGSRKGGLAGIQTEEQ
jgi:hypothetical protein